MHFVKMQGTGNDFVVINLFQEPLAPDMGRLARRMCDRHFGVGADGVLTVGPTVSADVEMRLFNADGSEAEMCGNGLRCVAKFARKKGLAADDVIRVNTLAGVKTAWLSQNRDGADTIRVDMGEPDFASERIPVQCPESEWIDRPLRIAGDEIRLTCVSMGNPHAVAFLQSPDDVRPEQLGPAIECHPSFPKRTNVEFVTGDEKGLHVVVWERGAGLTQACGTGACAVLSAAVRLGLSGRNTTVWLPGGPLDVEWGQDNHLYLSGPAMEVFEGEWPES